MILLPNGCSCSGNPGNPSKGIAPSLFVSPENWNTKKASVRTKWKIQYRFYDPAFNDDPKIKGKKQVVIKKMNRFSTLEERQEATRALMDSELEMLIGLAYNPITGHFIEPVEQQYEIDPQTLFIDALRLAHKKLKKEKSTLDDIKFVIDGIEKAAVQLRYKTLPISSISRKHIKLLLEQCGRTNKRWSANRFNKYRSYLMMLFNELIELEATEIDPVAKIRKQKTIRKIRVTLTKEERKRVDDHLFKKYYTFWRFTHIFFHSGSRESEMMLLKAADVDLDGQRFKVLVKKGSVSREEWRPIKDIAKSLWVEVVSEANKSDYLFSKGLKPGLTPINPWQITRRWREHVKAPVDDGGLGIKADFYSLKHSNLDETAEALSKEAAARMAGHTSTVVTMDHYLVGEKDRDNERLKKMTNSFV